MFSIFLERYKIEKKSILSFFHYSSILIVYIKSIDGHKNVYTSTVKHEQTRYDVISILHL